jgi:hypothetical protein
MSSIQIIIHRGMSIGETMVGGGYNSTARKIPPPSSTPSAAYPNPTLSLSSPMHVTNSRIQMSILHEFITAVPTAEPEPITHNYIQSGEADMGFTYDELSVFGRLRKNYKLGPWGTFE